MNLTNITHLYADSSIDQPIYCIESDTKVRIGLMAAGASVAFVYTPDKKGTIKNIALSLQNCADYYVSDTYAGATIGPVAGRIRNGILPILGKVYDLPKNDAGNTLHSGSENLGHTLWRVQDTFCNSNQAGVIFTQHLSHGQNGFPGERDISVCYTLSCDNTLKIQYTATTDKNTWINLTNHTYWNLTGDFTKPADRQILQISADKVYYNNSAHLPVSLEDVKGTPFDFETPRPVAAAMQSNPSHKQLVNASGYNNAYLLREDCESAAVMYDPVSGRRITMTTDYPSLVFYSGGYLINAGYTMDHQKIAAGSAYALEAQYLPDAPHLQGGEAPFLKKREIYRKTIGFHFDVI